jgi:prepilin-type N-terminal cleavage/methylation domain-containing protein
VHLPVPSEPHRFGGVLMRPASGFLLSPRHNLHLSLREKSASVTRRVRAFLTAPSRHPASAARLLTSPAGRGKEAGFSLIELAIVLVILGLLVGGIMTGQSLIRAAELRSVTSEFNGFVAATQTFRDKYFALPGDMTNATAFWGAAHATLATCKTTAGTGTQTCNGNGDGFIGFSPTFSEWYETYLFWEHLANAGLIEGAYTGIISGGGSFHVTIGTNIPRSRISNAGWTLQSAGIAAGWWSTLNRDHMFQLGAPTSSGSSDVWNNGVILKPDDAWNIDTKIDDGKPGTGTVMNFPANSTCTTTDVAATAAYNLTNNSVVCAPMFKAGF